MNINDIAGKMVKVGKASITVKDEYNKTRGIVKNICTWNILPPRQQGDYFRLINICNIRNAKPELLEKCVLVCDGELYLLKDMARLESWKKIIDMLGEEYGQNDLKKYNAELELYTKAQEVGIKVIKVFLV